MGENILTKRFKQEYVDGGEKLRGLIKPLDLPLKDIITTFYNIYLGMVQTLPPEIGVIKYKHPKVLQTFTPPPQDMVIPPHQKLDPYMNKGTFDYNKGKEWVEFKRSLLENGTYWALFTALGADGLGPRERGENIPMVYVDPFGNELNKPVPYNVVMQGHHRTVALHSLYKEGLWPPNQLIAVIETKAGLGYNWKDLKDLHYLKTPVKIKVPSYVLYNVDDTSPLRDDIRKHRLRHMKINWVDKEFQWVECWINDAGIWLTLLDLIVYVTRDKMWEYKERTGKDYPTSEVINVSKGFE